MAEQNNSSTLIPGSSVFVAIPSNKFATEKQSQFYNATIQSRVEKHSGNYIYKEPNIVIAYFAEVANAVNCAINIQETIATYNEKNEPADKINIQIGIHYGELFLTGNAPQGDLVDVANEVAQITPTNKIYISREVYNRARVKLLVQMSSIGEQTLPLTQTPKIIFNVDWESVEINLYQSLSKIPGESNRKKNKREVYEPRKEQNKTIIFLVFGIIIALLLYMRYQKWL